MGPLVPEIVSGGLNLVLAIFIGIAFGYILEQAGFSSTRKLAGLFYGYDFTVLKVFFTAAVVAAIGIVFFNYFGLLNLDVIFINPTFWPSAIVGGIIMGVGFIIGGFCPGTSVCATFIGKKDAMFFIIGIFAGIFLFTLTYPAVVDFYKAGSMGPVMVYDSLGMSRGLFMFLFIVIALGSFVFATIWEKKINKVDEHPEKPYFKKYYAGLAITFVLAIILIFLPDWKTSITDTAAEYAETKAGEISFVSADELAFKLMHEYSDIEIIDVRSADAYKKDNIPTAVNIPLADMTDKEWYDYIRKNTKTLIFYSDDNTDAQKAYFIAREYGHQWNAVLDGGFNNFAQSILNFTGDDAASINTIQGKWDYRFRERAREEMKELKKKAANKNKPKKKKAVRVVGGC
jgi:rhodanese-related sulfurtransferase/uncharacterized membrane protein YedE/YeeE